MITGSVQGVNFRRTAKAEGNDKMILEFFEEPIKTKIYLNDFIEALQDAKALLL